MRVRVRDRVRVRVRVRVRATVGELDLHVIVHLVHAPQPVRLRVHQGLGLG